MRELIDPYRKRVQDLAEHVQGNEQATKQSLIGPLLTLLGYDLTDPRECIPEYRVDFGRDRSVKPIDWAFLRDGRPIFFVEAKEVGKKLGNYDEQLADYFAKAPEAKLGILTNGVQWRFFTDVENTNVMDREPFVKWDVLADEQPPYDFLTLLQKSQFNPQLIRTFAERKRAQNLLLAELARLLEPSSEFIRLAIANIETRKLTESVVESWRPVLVNAIGEWAKQRTLTAVLESPPQNAPATSSLTEPAAIVTTQVELDGLETVRRLLGPDRPVTYEDTLSYFKIHLPERNTWTVCRLYFDRRRPVVWLALPIEQAQPLIQSFPVTSPQQGWSSVSMKAVADLEQLGDALRAAWDYRRAQRSGAPEATEPETSPDAAQPGPIDSVQADGGSAA
jgi:predicted type IV restriction endonuclease